MLMLFFQIVQSFIFLIFVFFYPRENFFMEGMYDSSTVDAMCFLLTKTLVFLKNLWRYAQNRQQNIHQMHLSLKLYGSICIATTVPLSVDVSSYDVDYHIVNGFSLLMILTYTES